MIYDNLLHLIITTKQKYNYINSVITIVSINSLIIILSINSLTIIISINSLIIIVSINSLIISIIHHKEFQTENETNKQKIN